MSHLKNILDHIIIMDLTPERIDQFPHFGIREHGF
jgi:hypothetical protein